LTATLGALNSESAASEPDFESGNVPFAKGSADR
jgi:hypothetical protein